jgi:hypothetical protein
MSQINKYKEIFDNGYFLRNGKKVSMHTHPVFDGGGVNNIKHEVTKFLRKRPDSMILDFGCGNAIHWHKKVSLRFKDELINFPEFLGEKFCGFQRYDPAHPVYNRKPIGKFDLILCTDVLEHIPLDELPFVLDEIDSYMHDSSEAIFSIPKNESKNAFVDGENMHCTLMSFDEWSKIITENIPRKKISIFHYD